MVTTRAPVEILERARRAGDLEPAEIAALTRFWVDGIATDTQMAAWCAGPAAAAAGPPVARAICRVLVGSGRRLSPASLGATADKQSSGGVGDATSLVAVPLAAALGATVLKLSGDGREHLGGTLTKLGAIPGMDVGLDARGLLRAARDGGAVIAGGKTAPAPAVARLEALLGDIGGVGAPAVLAAMTAARALATGSSGVVVHMTHGPGGVFATPAEATRAADMARTLIEAAGGRVRAAVSAVEAPLGPTVGNALEVSAAAAVLRGEAGGDLRAVACALAGAMLETAGVCAPEAGATAAGDALDDGRGLEAAERWVAGQGGDPAVWTDPERVATTPLTLPVSASRSGAVTSLDPRAIGLAVRMLGAGRLHANQGVDYAVGAELLVRPGDDVAAGEVVARVHARDPGLGERAVGQIAAAVSIDEGSPAAAHGLSWRETFDA